VADEYRGGHLDWYAFDVDRRRRELVVAGAVPRPPHRLRSDFLATLVSFEGMPNRRWWQFENKKVNFGRIEAHTTDLGRLLLMEFALIYANDWFVVPFELPVGSLARVTGLVVTNVFGERQWIPASASSAEPWALFTLERRDDAGLEPGLFLPPTVVKSLEGKPVEHVRLLRDEIANMVWAVERRVQLEDGSARDGAEAASERAAFRRRLDTTSHAGPEAPSAKAALRYRLMTTVPEHWIPFIPVRVPDTGVESRRIQLQRGTLLRAEGGGETIRPQTRILRQNLGGPYFIHEEEVPREGTEVELSWQRTRWFGGEALVWLGRRRRTGRGEGSSGLVFDQLDMKR
jgi:hypothetical protein